MVMIALNVTMMLTHTAVACVSHQKHRHTFNTEYDVSHSIFCGFEHIEFVLVRLMNYDSCFFCKTMLSVSMGIWNCQVSLYLSLQKCTDFDDQRLKLQLN